MTHAGVIVQLLSDLDCDHRNRSVHPDKAFAAWAKALQQAREQKKRVYFVGNGPGASLASQFAIDLGRRAHLHTEVFNDLAMMSAIANEIGYEWIFADPLRRRAAEGDLLVCLSTSGRSENIIKAVELAAPLSVETISLTGSEADNPVRSKSELNFHVNAKTRGDAQVCFQAIMNHAINLVQIDESQTSEISYRDIYSEFGRPQAGSGDNPDPAFFLP
jgi:D-sedoheptulose 7-phosphate isomerase